MTLNKSLMSSKRDSWNTPECVLELVRRVFGRRIQLDPCSNPTSIVDAFVSYREDLGADGLSSYWGEHEFIYVNPPYTRKIIDWIDKCNKESKRCKHAEIIALLPARTDTLWFDGVWDAAAICFWFGRLRFLGAPSSAPFPSVVAYWGPRRYRFADVFSEVGRVVMP